ncbi:MAG: polymer-forming cytoskeletal protein [Gammaproteobacteria bacterium]|nr:polymer-forming cytoskeletal protein [Gammaproteobacteria bacterium]
MFAKQKKGAARVKVDTIIGAKGRIEGDLHFGGGLHLDGTIHGRVIAESLEAALSVSEQGRIVGEVQVAHIILNGQVEGDVYASAHIELGEKAFIAGNVYYGLIEMALGAQVNGSLIHLQESDAPALLAIGNNQEKRSEIP